MKEIRADVKIIGYSKVTAEGIVLNFEKPISLNGGIKTDEWFLSWGKISDLIADRINKDCSPNCEFAHRRYLDGVEEGRKEEKENTPDPIDKSEEWHNHGFDGGKLYEANRTRKMIEKMSKEEVVKPLKGCVNIRLPKWDKRTLFELKSRLEGK